MVVNGHSSVNALCVAGALRYYIPKLGTRNPLDSRSTSTSRLHIAATLPYRICYTFPHPALVKLTTLGLRGQRRAGQTFKITSFGGWLSEIFSIFFRSPLCATLPCIGSGEWFLTRARVVRFVFTLHRWGSSRDDLWLTLFAARSAMKVKPHH